MQITRRKFINAACASAIIAAGGGITASFGQRSLRNELFPIPVEVYSEPLFSMNARQLHRFIGNQFTASMDGYRPAALVLSEVKTLERSQNAIGGSYGECFSLLFTSSERRPLPQGTYIMTADGLESFAALLVPVDPNRVRYEIIINHVTR